MIFATSREDGFTIIEVLMAALILVLGAIATFGVLASATIDNQRAKATQIALNKAQEEIEALHSLSDEELALSSTPEHSSDEANPDFRVSNGKFNVNRTGAAAKYEMAVKGGVLYPDKTITTGAVSPGPTPFTSGDVSGDVYRYIVWRNDPSCAAETCPGEQDYKQVIVAVKLNARGNGSSPGGYVEVQSSFVNPEHSAADNPIPGAEGVVTAQQFFLSDTSCSSSGEASRQAISGDHPLHNTLGTCASGQQTGSTLGAPDALLTGAPPDPYPQEPSLPAVYDYSSDYSNTITAATAKGIQIRREDIAGECNPSPGGSSPQWQVHRWVTDRMPKTFVMTNDESVGSVTLDFFTRALSDSQYPGKLCIYLFVRKEETSEGEVKATDTFLANREGGLPFWTYVPNQGNADWWQNEWREVPLTMKFNRQEIKEGERLGVAFSVDASTLGDGVSILYDHPDYRSRIEVHTTTPLEGG